MAIVSRQAIDEEADNDRAVDRGQCFLRTAFALPSRRVSHVRVRAFACQRGARLERVKSAPSKACMLATRCGRQENN
jgi:hypothetical protein